MNETNQNSQDEICCGCKPMIEDTDQLRSMRPILNGGIIFYIILLLLDLFYLRDIEFLNYIIMIISLCIFNVNRCFIIFPIYTIASIFLVFMTAFPKIGIIIQNKFKYNQKEFTNCIIKFCIYVSIIIFSCIIFNSGFKAYKEIRYIFNKNITENRQNVPSYIASYNTSNNNDDNNNSNNNSNAYSHVTNSENE